LGPHIQMAQYTVSGLELVCGGARFTKEVAIPFIRYLCHRTDPVDISMVVPEDDETPAELRVDAHWAANIHQVLSAQETLNPTLPPK